MWLMAMSTYRFRECLDILGWSQRGLAGILECSDRLPKDWATGRERVPVLIEQWLEKAASVRQAHPIPDPPKDWRRPRFGRQDT